MAKRFHSTFKDQANNFSYSAEIWDTSFSGSSTAFETAPDGLTVRYAGEGGERTARIIGTEVSLVMQMQNSTHEALVTDLQGAAEGRFSLKILKAGVPFWYGMVLPDIGRYDEAYYPIRFELKATDGIGILKDVDYTQADGSAYTGKQTVMQHITNCLARLPYVATHFDSGDSFVRSAVDWWETTMTNSSSGADALHFSHIDHATWYTFEKGVQKFLSCYQVLENLLVLYGARLTMAEGVFWIEQISYRTASTVVTRRYTKTGGFLSADNYSGSSDIDQSEQGALIATGNYEFFGALSKVKHTFKSFERRNFLAGVSIDHIAPIKQVYNPINSNSNAATLRLTGQLSGTVSNTTPVPDIKPPLILVFKITVELDTQALKRGYTLTPTFQVNYSAAEWDTAPQFCYYAVTFPGGLPMTGAAFNQKIDIEIPTLPENATSFRFGIQFHSFGYFSGATLNPSNYTFHWALQNGWLELYSNGNPALLTDETEYECLNSIHTTNTVLQSSESLVGTSTDPNVLGALWVKPSSTYILATLWGDGTDARTKAIEALMTEIVLSGQATPVKRLNGTLFGNLAPMRRILWDGSTWLLLGGSYQAGSSEFSGEWFELSYLPGLSTSPPRKYTVTVWDQKVPPGATAGLNGSSGRYEVVSKPPGTLMYPVAQTTTSAVVVAGATTSLPVSTTLATGDFYAGDTITIVNPITGFFESLSVTTTSVDGDTAIAVSGTLENEYIANAPIIKKPLIGTFSLPAGNTGQVLRHNGNKWVPYGTTALAEGVLLTWNDATGWTAQPPATSGTVTGTGTAGQVAFWTLPSAIGGENALWYDATNDRLGVGTNSPAERIHVAGKAKIKADSGATNVTLESDNAWDVVFLQFQTADRVLAAFRSSDNNQRFSIELGAYETAMLLSSGLNNSKTITIQSSNLKLQSGTSPYPYFFEFGNNGYSPYGQDASLQTDLNLQFRGQYNHIQFPVNHAEVGTSGAYWSVGRGAGNSDKFQIRIQQAGANSFSDALTILATGTAAAKAFQYMGVGTASPSEALHIVGNLRFSGALMPNGSAGTTGYILISAGPGSPPVWRLLLAADIPNLPASIITSGILAYDRGGTGTGTIGTAGQLARVNSGATALEYFTATYLTANQTITITGDATGSGTTSITLTLAANVVTFAKFQQISTARLLGRSTSGTGNVEQISIGSGLSLSGGVLSASGGLGGSLTATRIPFAADATTLDDDANLTWDDTNKRLSIGNTGGSPQAQLHIADGSVSGTWEGWRAIATASANVLATLYNAYNLGAAGNTIYDIGVGGPSAGDPMIRFLVSTIGQWCMGVDNSDGDKFRILYDSTPNTTNAGITITNAAASLVGINKNAPSHPLDVAGRSRADLMQGVSGTLTSVFGTGAGTSPTLTSLTGTANGFSLQFTTGTSPSANGNVISINVPTSFSSTQYPVFCAANAQTATDLTKFYISAANSTSFTLTANGTLAASTTYKFYFNIWGI